MPDVKRGHQRPKYRAPSKDYTGIFTRTIESYLESKFLIDCGNIPASNPDRSAKRPLSLFIRAEHLTDIEKAVRAALHTTEHEDCFDAMLKEIAGTAPVDLSFSLGIRVDVVQRCGREFERKKVTPYLYFGSRKK